MLMLSKIVNRTVNTISYVIKDYYQSYMDHVKNNILYEVDYRTFRDIVSDYFKLLRDDIILNSKEVKLPCRLGSICVTKTKISNYIFAPGIDFHETKRLNKTIFHLNEHSGGYKYRFHWCKKDSILTNKFKYQLIMSRANKRLLAKIIKNNERDYIEK